MEIINVASDLEKSLEATIVQQVERFVKPFNLRESPLIRAKILELAKDKCVLMFDMHHIISDGISINILIKELVSFYKGEELPELKIQYKDFSEWQNQMFEKDEFKKKREFWFTQLADEIPILNIPTDFPRPPVQNFDGR